MAARWKRAAILALVASAPLAFSETARAQGPVAAAQALFDDGKRLMGESRFNEACPMFQESDRLAPGIGTKFNLADCHERQGRTATAWAEFIAVASAARLHAQPGREEVARARAKALETKLSRLVIVVPAELRTAGLEVQRDADPVGPSQWEREIPVDPGTHRVAAHDGTLTWHAAIDVAAAATARVVVGPLEETAPAAPPKANADAVHEVPTPAPEPTAPTGNGRTVAAIALGALGVAGLAVGTVFGLQSISKYDDSQPYCKSNSCGSTGLSLREESIHSGNIATVAIITGAVALIAGGVIWLTAPKPTHAPR